LSCEHALLQVDNAEFDNEQLFLGTIFFTFLLFLLPTTAVYLLVMTALRLCVFAIHCATEKCIDLIDFLLLYHVDCELL
jgi:phosphatidylinositol glycan class Q protein